MSANLKSEIAAAQKARARYGRFFSKERLCQMAGLSNLQELAASIRENSFYADGFGNLSDAAVNRESLEKILKERLYTDLAELFGFDFALGSKLYRLSIIDCEKELVMSFARLLNAGKSEFFRPSLPDFLERHLDIDLSALRAAKDFDDLLGCIKKRDMILMVSLCRPAEGQPIDLSLMEFLFEDYFCKKVVEISDGDEKIVEIFGIKADFLNLQMILRQKTYFDATPGEIKLRLLSIHGIFKKKVLEQLCEGKAEDVNSFIEQSKYSDYFKNSISADIAAGRAVRDICRKTMRFDTSPSSVLSAYMLLANNQYDCLTTLVEGVRYSLGSEKITELLPV